MSGPVKISDLTSASALGGTETVAGVQGSSGTYGGTVKILISQIGTYVRGLFTTTPATIAEGGTGSATATAARAALGIVVPLGASGRLTLVSGNPLVSGDTTGATTMYYTPFKGDYIPIYDGSNFQWYQFSEMSQATTDATKSPAAVANNSGYDFFVWLDGSTLRCTRGPAWSSLTSRGSGAGTTELQYIQGRYVNKYAITNGPAATKGTFVGSARSDGSAQFNDVGGQGNAGDVTVMRYVSNYYNQVPLIMCRQEVTDSWTYTTAAYRQANANTANQFNVFCCDTHSAFIQVRAMFSNSGAAGSVSVAVAIADSGTTIIDGTCIPDYPVVLVTNQRQNLGTTWTATISSGYHFYAWIEFSGATGTTTWYGDVGAPSIGRTGMIGWVMG